MGAQLWRQIKRLRIIHNEFMGTLDTYTGDLVEFRQAE